MTNKKQTPDEKILRISFAAIGLGMGFLSPLMGDLLSTIIFAFLGGAVFTYSCFGR